MTQKVSLNLQDLRRSYLKEGLSEESVDANPFRQFETWFNQAQTAEVSEPNAMVLATVDAENAPNTRTVLLKAFDEEGLVFFTNYQSQKATEIDGNPAVSIQFLWLDLERQVKVRGQAHRISLKESMGYFFSRPKGSQIGAWVSHQSQVVSSRALLVNEYQKLKAKFLEGHVPYPDFWGGYRIEPTYFEFWQGGEDRLHDRIVYKKIDDVWQLSRLAP